MVTDWARGKFFCDRLFDRESLWLFRNLSGKQIGMFNSSRIAGPGQGSDDAMANAS
jgi:hypothetical protein